MGNCCPAKERDARVPLNDGVDRVEKSDAVPLDSPGGLFSTKRTQSSVALMAGLPAERVELQTVLENLFAQCYELGCVALNAGLLTEDDIVSREPFLFLGLPGLAVFECARRSIHTPGELHLADGTVLNDANRPHHPLSDVLFNTMNRLRSLLLDSHLAHAEVRQLQQAILFAGDRDRLVGKWPELTETRLAEINRIVGAVQSSATDLTRLELYLENFPLVLNRIVESSTRLKRSPAQANAI